jgi:hypothetical protein
VVVVADCAAFLLPQPVAAITTTNIATHPSLSVITPIPFE